MDPYIPDVPVDRQSKGKVDCFVSTTKDNLVLIEYSSTLKWIAITPQGARALANDLLKSADAIRRKLRPSKPVPRKRRWRKHKRGGKQS